LKVLLDECLPVLLRHDLPGHAVETVQYRRWKGIRNGRLLATAAGEGFDCVITTDLGMEHSQNPAGLPLIVYVLCSPSNDLHDLQVLVPELLAKMASPPSRPCFVHIG
jgi:predicted nuclease of predicted toxin-antitoxin system